MSFHESLPSTQTTVIDVPEPTNVTVRFAYNFFVPDERINDNGSVPLEVLQRKSNEFDSSFVDTIEFARTIPRFVTINWKPVVLTVDSSATSTTNGSNSTKHITKGISIAENISNLHYEDDFVSTNRFSGLHLQDSQSDELLRFVVEKARSVLLVVDSGSSTGSPLDQARLLNSTTHNIVSTETLAKALFSGNGTTFDKPMADKVASELKSVRNSFVVNNKVIADLLQSASEESNALLGNELIDKVQAAKRLQEVAAKHENATVVSIDDYETVLPRPIRLFAIDPELFVPVVQPVGYIVEKLEMVGNNGAVKQLNPLIVEDNRVGSVIDFRIKYGGSYVYNVRTVVYVELVTYTHQTAMVAGFLLASKPVKTQVINCVETKPPGPPTDFKVRWDYNTNTPVLTWNFPVEPQRDVRYFQVFRRSSIYQPFELVRMFDFNDAIIVKSPLSETNIDVGLIEKLKPASVRTMFQDTEFKKNETWIYTVCCVDAHGMSSNYTTQFAVWFDHQSNKLKTKLVSTSGAPKSYPNMFLNVDTFVDVMKDEGHTSKLEIVFNPEVLKATNNEGNDLGLLKQQYMLQLINVDLQSSQTINIAINDKTTSDSTHRRQTNERPTRTTAPSSGYTRRQ